MTGIKRVDYRCPLLRDAFRVPRGEGLPRGCLSQQYGSVETPGMQIELEGV